VDYEWITGAEEYVFRKFDLSIPARL
jgi:hypothetical protein